MSTTTDHSLGSAFGHEMRSLREYIAGFDGVTPEIRIRNIEGGQSNARPFILITPLTVRPVKDYRFGYSANRRCVVTVFGSREEDVDDYTREAWQFQDMMNDVLITGTRGDGPLIRVWDFSEDPPVEADAFMSLEDTSQAELRQDEFGLYKVVTDVRYTVERYVPQPTEPIVTSIHRKVVITLP